MDAYRTAPAHPAPPAPPPFERRPSAALCFFAWTVQVAALIGFLVGFDLFLLRVFPGYFNPWQWLAVVPVARLSERYVALRARSRRGRLYPSPWFFW